MSSYNILCFVLPSVGSTPNVAKDLQGRLDISGKSGFMHIQPDASAPNCQMANAECFPSRFWQQKCLGGSAQRCTYYMYEPLIGRGQTLPQAFWRSGPLGCQARVTFVRCARWCFQLQFAQAMPLQMHNPYSHREAIGLLYHAVKHGT